MIGRWWHLAHKEQIQVAIGRRVSNPQFRVIPILLPDGERPRRGDVTHLDVLLNATWVEFLTALDDARAFRKLVCAIKGEKYSTS